jgi:hypothetical protein
MTTPFQFFDVWKPKTPIHPKARAMILGTRYAWFAKDSTGKYILDAPSENITRRTARRATGVDTPPDTWLTPPVPVLIDIEEFALDFRNVPDGADLDERLDKMALVPDWIHDEVPACRCGFYRIMPQREWFAVFRANEYPQWVQRNARLRRGRTATGKFEVEGLADKVDFICPSLYLFYPDKLSDIPAYLAANLAEARRYGKQMYPVVCPRFQAGDKTLVPVDTWRLVLDTVRDAADGVVLWAGGSEPESSPWVQATRDWCDTRL